jgi:hypothetical protein
MIDLTRRASQIQSLIAQKTNTGSLTNKGRSAPVSNRFAAALGSVSGTRGAAARSEAGPTSEPGRSNSVLGPMQQLFSSVVPPIAAAAVRATEYTGPQDVRDGISDQAGKLTAGGTPSIVRLITPVANQWGYSGEAAFNPYFTTPSNPMRAGLVAGYSQWFEENRVQGLTDSEMNINYSATRDGAQEVLRLVQQYDPGATLGSTRFGASGGPWLANKDTQEVVLSNGKRLNAGLLLGSYYNHGYGVNPRSDQALQLSISA